MTKHIHRTEQTGANLTIAINFFIRKITQLATALHRAMGFKGQSDRKYFNFVLNVELGSTNTQYHLIFNCG